jgi:tetratricopeptide (TPR) repeat protein
MNQILKKMEKQSNIFKRQGIFRYSRIIIITGLIKKLVFAVLILTTSVFAQKENKFIRSGNNKYYDNNYKEAEVDYMKALEKKPGSFKGQYNLSGAMYKQENYEDATKLYQNLAVQDSDKDYQADTYYNLGNAFVKGQKYKEGIEAYKNALRINPDDMEAKYNLEYARKMLKQQQQQQQDQQQNKDQEKKDQENKDQEQQQQKQQEQNQQQENQQQEQQQQNEQQQQQQQKPQPQQFSKQDAERMLEALKNDENKTMEKVKLQQVQQASVKKVEKDW